MLSQDKAFSIVILMSGTCQHKALEDYFEYLLFNTFKCVQLDTFILTLGQWQAFFNKRALKLSFSQNLTQTECTTGKLNDFWIYLFELIVAFAIFMVSSTSVCITQKTYLALIVLPLRFKAQCELTDKIFCPYRDNYRIYALRFMDSQ